MNANEHGAEGGCDSNSNTGAGFCAPKSDMHYLSELNAAKVQTAEAEQESETSLLISRLLYSQIVSL